MSRNRKGREHRFIAGFVDSIERTAIIRIKGIPDLDDPEKWAVMLESRDYDIEDNSVKTFEIARIDNYHKDKPVHIHRFFEKGSPEENLNYLDFEQAREYLNSNYEEFMQRFFSR
ncbi:MAG: hypothetical protein ABEJ56_02385 [Candidatus Nanohaloarchaea archaeon]